MDFLPYNSNNSQPWKPRKYSDNPKFIATLERPAHDEDNYDHATPHYHIIEIENVLVRVRQERNLWYDLKEVAGMHVMRVDSKFYHDNEDWFGNVGFKLVKMGEPKCD